MEVLILSKTKYGESQYCIGGLSLTNNNFIRLLNPGGYYQPIDTDLNIGDVWDISFTPLSQTTPPHNEDVIVNEKSFIRHIYNLKTFITNKGVRIWNGHISNVFDGTLRWTRIGSGYLSENQVNLPTNSVGFWTPNEDLLYEDGYYHIDGKKINYKGATTPTPIIKKGSLIRLSLAKWWCPDDFFESRCYLQLSGIYEDKPKPEIKASGFTFDEPQQKTPTKNDNSKNNYTKEKSEGCYIATACYGSYDAPEVYVFRNFRDFCLRKYQLGNLFVTLYYKYSPSVSKYLKEKKTLNNIVKTLFLKPLLVLIKQFGLDKVKAP